MPRCKLVIAPAARNDLLSIYQYGSVHWGTTRASDYMHHLKEQIRQLMAYPEMGVARRELLPAIRSLTVKSHVVFYRRQSKQIEIIRVLSGRQDPHLHLSFREESA